MLAFAEGELKNEISTGKRFQINATIDFLLVKRSKVFSVRMQILFPNNDFEPSISQYSISDTKNDNNYCHLNKAVASEASGKFLRDCLGWECYFPGGERHHLARP